MADNKNTTLDGDTPNIKEEDVFQGRFLLAYSSLPIFTLLLPLALVWMIKRFRIHLFPWSAIPEGSFSKQ